MRGGGGGRMGEESMGMTVGVGVLVGILGLIAVVCAVRYLLKVRAERQSSADDAGLEVRKTVEMEIPLLPSPSHSRESTTFVQSAKEGHTPGESPHHTTLEQETKASATTRPSDNTKSSPQKGVVVVVVKEEGLGGRADVPIFGHSKEAMGRVYCGKHNLVGPRKKLSREWVGLKGSRVDAETPKDLRSPSEESEEEKRTSEEVSTEKATSATTQDSRPRVHKPPPSLTSI